jgi:hypothetical protein
MIGDTCAHCGVDSTARGTLHAALRPDTDPDRLAISPKTGCWYSSSPDDYEALCVPCHYRQDFGLRPNCRNGHAYTPENTGVGKGGSRKCMTCDVDGKRARYANRVKGSTAGGQTLEYKRAWKAANPDKVAQYNRTRNEKRAAAKAAKAAAVAA